MIQVPDELRQRPVEVIVLPVEEINDLVLPVLTGSNAVANARKVIRKGHLTTLIEQSIFTLQQEATQNGLTPALLDELLGEDD